MANALALSWIGFGDIVQPTTLAGAREAHFVMHACDVAIKGYYCEPCDQHLANPGNLAMHLESGGVHRIAIWCPRHRVYEAPEPSQIRAFGMAEVRS